MSFDFMTFFFVYSISFLSHSFNEEAKNSAESTDSGLRKLKNIKRIESMAKAAWTGIVLECRIKMTIMIAIYWVFGEAALISILFKSVRLSSKFAIFSRKCLQNVINGSSASSECARVIKFFDIINTTLCTQNVCSFIPPRQRSNKFLPSVHIYAQQHSFWWCHHVWSFLL